MDPNNDADWEMAALTEAGNLHARRVRKWGREVYARMEAGKTVELDCISKDDGQKYTVKCRLDGWDGAILSSAPEYSMNGEQWFDSAREARRTAKLENEAVQRELDREAARRELQQQYPDGVTTSPDA